MCDEVHLTSIYSPPSGGKIAFAEFLPIRIFFHNHKRRVYACAHEGWGGLGWGGVWGRHKDDPAPPPLSPALFFFLLLRGPASSLSSQQELSPAEESQSLRSLAALL